MTAKEYLNQIRRLDASISARIHELQELQKMATYLTGIRYDADRVQSTKTDTGFPGAERIPTWNWTSSAGSGSWG